MTPRHCCTYTDDVNIVLQQWKPSIEFDNWGNPLPTASQATINAWKAAKQQAKMEELNSRSTFPYDDQSVVVK